ncbi:MAG: peptidoglycan DD-metalloendopeptidase family protein [Desulfovibrio sp.]|nr:peptidoglycan DD-metalloendopeptidase family protein [Desulfovibrio sp.]
MKSYPKLLLTAILILACAAPANALAAIRLSAPDKAGRGNAFIARATSDEPIENFVFFWRDKTHPAKASKNEAGLYEAQILLPMALAEKRSQLEVGVGRRNKPETRKTITVTDIKRPVQKLTVDRKYVDPPEQVKARIAADREKLRKALSTWAPGRSWSLPLERPVAGGISSQFGLKRVFNGQPRGEHKGLDLRSPQGTPIKACADGVVVLVDDLYYSGKTAYINHGEGVFSAYLHMSEPKVKPGQVVRRGDTVGLVGATGRVTGPHLHLSMFAQGQPVDPLPLLENRQGAANE